MVLDTSALVFILLKEPGFEDLIERIGRARTIVIGTPTFLECAIVLTSRLKQDVRIVIAGAPRRMDAQIVPFTEEHFDTALDVFLRFGKGRHPAGLNFGDCPSFGIASVAELPLLFTGSDFARTGIPAA